MAETAAALHSLPQPCHLAPKLPSSSPSFFFSSENTPLAVKLVISVGSLLKHKGRDPIRKSDMRRHSSQIPFSLRTRLVLTQWLSPKRYPVPCIAHNPVKSDARCRGRVLFGTQDSVICWDHLFNSRAPPEACASCCLSKQQTQTFGAKVCVF